MKRESEVLGEAERKSRVRGAKRAEAYCLAGVGRSVEYSDNGLESYRGSDAVGPGLREICAAGHAAPAIVLIGDVASADLDARRPLGVVRALEKSSDAGSLLQAIEAGGDPTPVIFGKRHDARILGTPGEAVMLGAQRPAPELNSYQQR